MVLGDTVRPVCSYTIEALMSAVRMPLRSGFSARRRSASSPSASVARARSVTVRARTGALGLQDSFSSSMAAWVISRASQVGAERPFCREMSLKLGSRTAMFTVEATVLLSS
jgi:hypothetical protein